MTVHSLKTWPEYFAAVKDGSKTFEIRRNDRDFKVGDVVELLEFDPDKNSFVLETETGIINRLAGFITYLTDYEQKPGYVVLGVDFLGTSNRKAILEEALRQAVRDIYGMVQISEASDDQVADSFAVRTAHAAKKLGLGE